MWARRPCRVSQGPELANFAFEDAARVGSGRRCRRKLDDLARPRVRASASSYLHAVGDAVWKQWAPSGQSGWRDEQLGPTVETQRAHRSGSAHRPTRGRRPHQPGDRAELYLSARAVEWHLRNVYDELGVTPELRRALANLGQADPAGPAPGDPDAGRPGRVGVLLRRSYLATRSKSAS